MKVFKQFLKSDFFYPVTYAVFYLFFYILYSYVTGYNTSTLEGFFAVAGMSVFTVLFVFVPVVLLVQTIKLNRSWKRLEQSLRRTKGE